MRKFQFLVVFIVSLFLAGPVQAQGPTPTPGRYHLLEDMEPITYTTWASASETMTQTLELSLDYRQMASYALTAYDFFANVSYIVYVLPFILAMKILHWLYKYVTGLRVDRNSQYEIDLSEIIGAMENNQNNR